VLRTAGVTTPDNSAEPGHHKQTAQILAMLRWLLILVFAVLGWFIVSYLAGVLAPILAALGIAYLLNPVLNRMVHFGFSRGIGAGILLIGFLALLVGAITFLTPRIAHQVSEFVRELPDMVQTLSRWLHDHVGIELPKDWSDELKTENLADSLGDVGGPLAHFASAAVGGVFSVLAVLAEFLLVPVFAFYFLSDWPHLLRRLDHMIPPRRRGEVRDLFREVDRVVAGWVRGQAIVTAILAVLYATGFTIVGMKLSLAIGLLVGALTVIPFVGTFVGATIALTVTLATGGGLTMLLSVAAVILVLHLLEAAVLTPKIVGHRVGLSESGALLAVVAGGKLLGFVGVVLAVPIAATVAVLVRYAVRYYEHTSFYGHESDADVVITPAMALIMPGVVPGAKIIATEHEPELEPELEDHDDWVIDTELGAAGAPPQPQPPEPELPEPQPQGGES
jgi:predicted PurR-regulated permease PerM